MPDNWAKKHQMYSKQDWIDKPSIFAQEVTEYFPKKGRLLELGAGQGQDSRYFASLGLSVVSTDNDTEALRLNTEKSTGSKNIEVTNLDISKIFPYEDESFEVVYAHLSLHYFDAVTSQKIIKEIYRVLKPGGQIALLVNSVSDPEYGDGEKIEEDYFLVGATKKRYFSTETLAKFVTIFKPIIFDNKGETYKDSAKGIHNLIRFVGKK